MHSSFPWKTFPPAKFILIFLISGLSILSFSLAVPAQTKPTSGKLQFVPPPTVGTPSGRPRGTAGRDDFPAVTIPLTALVPIPQAFGLTTIERPSFWFYLPYTKTHSNLKAEFLLLDKRDRNIYTQAIALPDQPSIINVTIPQATAPLALETNYRWVFKVSIAKPKSESVLDTSSPPVKVEGYIRRITPKPEIQKQLAAATKPQEKIAIYAANGIWFDCLTLLAQQHQKNPTDPAIKADWDNLLKSVKLDAIANQPIN